MKNMIRYATNWWSQRRPATRTLLQYILQGFGNFNRHGARQAAALAYYAVFSVFPLSLLLAVVVNSILGPAVAQEQVGSGLALFLPPETVNLLQQNVSGALQQSSSFGIIAVLGLIWSALGFFYNLTSSLDLIFRVPARRSVLRKRLMAFVMTIILVILVMASFITSGVLRLVAAVLPAQSNFWITVATFFLPLGLDMVILALLFRYVPSRRISWDAIWPAAIVGATGWELVKAGFEWYLTHLTNFQFVYGTIATVIVLLFWAYLSASIFLLSAELCAQLDDWLVAHHQEREKIYIEIPPSS